MNKKNYQNKFLEEKRKKSERFHFFVLSGITLIIGLFCIASCYAILNADFFKTKDIEVKGLNLVSRDALLSSISITTLNKSFLASSLGPDNILFWSFVDSHFVLEKNPKLAEISIETNFFNRTVAVMVRERIVSSVLCKKMLQKCFGMDYSGVVFTETPYVEGGLILKFEDDSEDGIVFGEKYINNLEWKSRIEETIKIMNENGFIPSSVRIKGENSEEWEVVMPSGLLFLYSLRFVPQNLSEVLNEISTKANFVGMQYFDFRVENRMYYK